MGRMISMFFSLFSLLNVWALIKKLCAGQKAAEKAANNAAEKAANNAADNAANNAAKIAADNAEKMAADISGDISEETRDIVIRIAREAAMACIFEFMKEGAARDALIGKAFDVELKEDLKVVTENCGVHMRFHPDDSSCSESDSVENEQKDALIDSEPVPFRDYSITSVMDDPNHELESVVIMHFNSSEDEAESESKSADGHSEDSLSCLDLSWTNSTAYSMESTNPSLAYSEEHLLEGVKELFIDEKEKFICRVKFMKNKIEDKFMRFRKLFNEGPVDYAESSQDSLRYSSEDEMECVEDLMSFIEHALDQVTQRYVTASPGAGELVELPSEGSADCTVESGKPFLRGAAEYDLSGVRKLFNESSKASKMIGSTLMSTAAEYELSGVRQLFIESSKTEKNINTRLMSTVSECDLSGVRQLFIESEKAFKKVGTTLMSTAAEYDLSGVRQLFNESAKRAEEIFALVCTDVTEHNLRTLLALFRRPALPSRNHSAQLLAVPNDGYVNGQKYDLYKLFCNVEIEYNFERGLIRKRKSFYRITMGRDGLKEERDNCEEIMKGPFYPRCMKINLEDVGVPCEIEQRVQSEYARGWRYRNRCSIEKQCVRGNGNGNGDGGGKEGGNGQGNDNAGGGGYSSGGSSSSDEGSSSSDDQRLFGDESSSSEDEQPEEERLQVENIIEQESEEIDQQLELPEDLSRSILLWSSQAVPCEDSLKREDAVGDSAYMLCGEGPTQGEEEDLPSKNEGEMERNDVRNGFKGNACSEGVKREEESFKGGDTAPASSPKLPGDADIATESGDLAGEDDLKREDDLKKEEDFKREVPEDETAHFLQRSCDVTNEQSGVQEDPTKSAESAGSSSFAIPPWKMQSCSGAYTPCGLFDGVDLGSFAIVREVVAEEVAPEVVASEVIAAEVVAAEEVAAEIIPAALGGPSDGADSDSNTHADEAKGDIKGGANAEEKGLSSDETCSDVSDNDDSTMVYEDSDLEQETEHRKKVLVPVYEEANADVVNGMYNRAYYTLPDVGQMPEDTKLKSMKSMYINRPTEVRKRIYKKYADTEAGKKWKEVSTVLNYTEKIVLEILSCLEKNDRFSSHYSTRYYYAKRIHGIYPEYRFSRCKAVSRFFHKLPLNPIREQFRDDYLETECEKVDGEMQFRSFKEIIKIYRTSVLRIMCSIRNAIADVKCDDMKSKIKEYREMYRTCTKESDDIYAEDHPYIVGLKKIDEHFSELREIIFKGRHIIDFYDYKMDRIIRTYESHLCYSYRFVRYWLHIFSRFFISQVQVWQLPQELPCQLFQKYEHGEEFILLRRMVRDSMFRYKECIEDGRFKPHIFEDMDSLRNTYFIYKYTRIFYDQLCIGFKKMRGIPVERVNDIFSEICLVVYKTVPSNGIVDQLSRIVMLVYSKDPPAWLSINDLENLLFDDDEEEECDCAAADGAETITGEEAKVEASHEAGDKNEGTNDSSVVDDVQKGDITSGEGQAASNCSPHSCPATEPHAVEPVPHTSNDAANVSAEKGAIKYEPFPCMNASAPEASAPQDGAGHIQGGVQISHREGGYIGEHPLPVVKQEPTGDVERNSALLSTTPAAVVGSGSALPSTTPAAVVERNSAALSPIPAAVGNSSAFLPSTPAAAVGSGSALLSSTPAAVVERNLVALSPIPAAVGNSSAFLPSTPAAAVGSGSALLSSTPAAVVERNLVLLSPIPAAVGNSSAFLPSAPAAVVERNSAFFPSAHAAVVGNGSAFLPLTPMAAAQNWGFSAHKQDTFSQSRETSMAQRTMESAKSEDMCPNNGSSEGRQNGLSFFALAQAPTADTNLKRTLGSSFGNYDHGGAMNGERDHNIKKSFTLGNAINNGYSINNQNNAGVPNALAFIPRNYDLCRQELSAFKQNRRGICTLDSGDNNPRDKLFKSETTQNQCVFNSRTGTWEEAKSENAFFKGEVQEKSQNLFHLANPSKQDDNIVQGNMADNFSKPLGFTQMNSSHMGGLSRPPGVSSFSSGHMDLPSKPLGFSALNRSLVDLPSKQMGSTPPGNNNLDNLSRLLGFSPLISSRQQPGELIKAIRT
ncbi:hypothetical protein PVNG_00791 [Plasmodium vivax North Korean]|uniref:Uncharacterized protein n=1 Tax=Plasmodium vivax North Korean TaxID=1035514 RepID=A0A0J9TUR7_PLAVI|nr:hypothetical protein PVNG_00791 [Plasmodium vivax North Korean]